MAKQCKNFWSLILGSTLSVALQRSAYLVVCREMQAACLHKTCAFTVNFDGMFAYNGEHVAALLT